MAGPTGAGKTTLLLHAMARQSARLGANDRVFVDVWTGRWRATGVPAVIRVHPRGARDFPALAAAVPSTVGPADLTLDEARGAISTAARAAAGTELRVTAAQLTRALGLPPRAAAPLRAIVFPEIQAGGESPRLARLTREDAVDRLRANGYGGRGHERVCTVFTEVVARACPRAQTDDAVERALADLRARLAAEVPCYRLAPGRDLGAAVDHVRRDVLA